MSQYFVLINLSKTVHINGVASLHLFCTYFLCQLHVHVRYSVKTIEGVYLC